MINRKARVTVTRIFLPIFFVWCVIVPRQSFAFVPAVVGGYGLPTLPASGSYAAASGSAAFAVGAAAFGVGMAIGYYGLEALLGDGTAGHVRVPLTSDPAKAVPAPAAAPSAGAPQLVYTATTGACVKTGSSADDACSKSVACAIAANGATTVSYIGAANGGCQVSFSTGGSNLFYGGYTSALGCPTGYNNISGTCTLGDARAAVPDHNCDFSRSGTSLTAISDPDCSAALAKMPFICANGTCTGQGVDSSGHPVNYLITPRADGGSTVTTQTQNTVSGQTQVQTTTVGVSSGGVVDGVSGSISAGSIPASSDGSATTPVTSTAPPLQSGSNPSPIQFPTDYARTGEAQTAANTLSPKLDTLHHDLSDTVSVNDPVLPDTSTMPWFGDTFKNLSGWSMPGHVSSCPQPSMDLSSVLGEGHVYVLSSHCTLINNNFGNLRTAMLVAWLILATFVVLRA